MNIDTRDCPKVYILLPVHNRLESTRRFVESLLAQSYDNYHLVLIDDGSTDGTADFVKGRVKSLTVITGRGDWWWAGGLHQGYCWLKKNHRYEEGIVLFINNDTEFNADFLKTAVDILTRHSKTLLISWVFSRKTREWVEAGVHVDWQRLEFKDTEDARKINCLSTRGLFLRVKDFFDIGDFHPILLPHYLSDYEFTIRAYRKGYRLLADPLLKLWFDEETTGWHTEKFNGGHWEFLRNYFSKRSSGNPIYWVSFLGLACPWPWKIWNILRTCYGGVKIILRKLFYSDGHR